MRESLLPPMPKRPEQLTLFDRGGVIPVTKEHSTQVLYQGAREAGKTVVDYVAGLHRAGVIPAGTEPKERPNHLSDQFEQLPMFMEVKEFRDNYITDSRESLQNRESMSELWKRKEQESRAKPIEQRPNADFTEMKNYPWGSGVYDSIKEHGYDWSKPVSVRHRWVGREMGQGHHRVAAMSALSEETGKDMYIPISHEEK